MRHSAIIDLCIGMGSNLLGSYVGITRVACKGNLLIYRPFPRDVFTQRPREGPQLLLRHLRHGDSDWKAVEEKHMPRKTCAGCAFVHCKESFQLLHWSCKDGISFCKDCVEHQQQANTPYRCNLCGIWKKVEAFPALYHHPLSVTTRVCNDCDEKRKCCVCSEEKPEIAFTKSEWDYARKRDEFRGKCKECALRGKDQKKCGGPCERLLPVESFKKDEWRKGSQRKCLACMQRSPRIFWTCVECKLSLHKDQFSIWLRHRTAKRNNGTARCNMCQSAQQEMQ